METKRLSQYCDHNWIIRLDFEIGRINILSHIFATLGAHPTELDLMRTRLLNFDNVHTRWGRKTKDQFRVYKNSTNKHQTKRLTVHQ